MIYKSHNQVKLHLELLRKATIVFASNSCGKINIGQSCSSCNEFWCLVYPN